MYLCNHNIKETTNQLTD